MQGDLRVELELTRQVCDGEEQVPNFLGELFLRVRPCQLCFDLGDLLIELVYQAAAVGPVKTASGSGGTKFLCFKQGRQRTRHPLKLSLKGHIWFCFHSLNSRPVIHHRVCPQTINGEILGAVTGFHRGLQTEDMRVTPHQLPVQVSNHFLNREVALPARYLCIKQHLQQQVAELLAQVGPVLPLDRVQHLVRLFQCVFANGGKALLAVPGAPARTTQPLHDGYRFLKRRACRHALHSI